MLNALAGSDGPVKLDKLRRDPKAAVSEYGFVVAGSANYDGRMEGGPCTISCKPLGNNIYELTPSSGAGADYYFPYVPQGTQEGVGQCRVPSGARDGTIVLTGAMNGCSLDVRRSGGDLVFRHVANGASKDYLKQNDSNLMCRVDHKAYMLPGWEQSMAASVGERSTRSVTAGAVPMHYLISVKQGAGWLVLDSALMQVKTVSGGQAKTSYERLRSISTITPVVSSF